MKAAVLLLALTAAACGSSETNSGSGSGGSGASSNGGGGSGGSAGSVSCGAGGVDAVMACVEESRLKDDVTFIAAPRPPGSSHWQEVQDLCAARFQQYGFEVELEKYGTGVNVIGKRTGQSKPGEQVIISAHYDHIPNCPGADDNGSGVAAVLETARVLEHAKLGRTLILACWDEEETGLLGSEAYAARAQSQGDSIVSMISLEMIGYQSTQPNTQSVPTGFNLLFPEQYKQIQDDQMRADFVAFVAVDSASELANALHARAGGIGLPNVLLSLSASQAQSALLADLRRSDHASFWDHGYPAIMLTDTSNFRYAQYHCMNGDDVPSLLDFGFMAANTRTSLGAHLDVLGLL